MPRARRTAWRHVPHATIRVFVVTVRFTRLIASSTHVTSLCPVLIGMHVRALSHVLFAPFLGVFWRKSHLEALPSNLMF